MKRLLVSAVAKIDEAVDEVLYRPAVVKMFDWLPHWWLCDLAKVSLWLDDRWHTSYWGTEGVPGGACAACGRRAAWLEISGVHPEEDDPIALCGWCNVRGPVKTEEDLQRELGAAREASVSWRWRWPVWDG